MFKFLRLKKFFNQNFTLKPETFSIYKFLFIWEYCYIRFLYYFCFKKKFNFYKKTTATAGIEYSKKAFYDGRLPVYRPHQRVLFPFFNLISDPSLKKNTILIIGPRYENEIFIAKAMGFKNVYALDNYSYSPLVDIGDMHNMKYEDNFFDAIICGWTLPYSKNPIQACKEMKRVLKNNGSLCICVSKIYSDSTKLESIKKIDGILVGGERLQTKKQFEKIFYDLRCVSCFEDFKDEDSQFLITFKKD